MPNRDGPLAVLRIKLLSQGVPSISSLIGQLGDIEGYVDFLKLVQQYLPERERDIMLESSPAAQVARFSSYFGDRYFPLEDHLMWEESDEYREITDRIPVIIRGISYDDYHEIAENARDGILLLTYISANPFGEGRFVSITEACQEHVPQELLDRAAGIELEPDEAQRIFAGTKYEPVTFWVKWLHGATGNFFLDTDYELLWSGYAPEWDPEMVEHLTGEWQRADLDDNKLDKFVQWIEEDMLARFEELVNFILEKRNNG